MSLISDSVIFIVDSSKALTGAGTGSFTAQINIPKGHDYDRVCVLQAIIPKSYYLVNAPNNTMTLLENGVSTTITMIPGNYNAKSFCTIISSLLTSRSSQGWTYAITYPNPITQVDTGMFTYTVSGNGSLQPSFIFPTLGIHEVWGFHAGTTNAFVNNTVTSSHVIKMQVEDVIFIHSDIAYNNDQSSYCDVLQEIYASSTPTFSNIVYQNTGNLEAYSKKLRSGNNNMYTFTITDENNSTLNLNGLNCVFTMIAYKKDDVNQIIALDKLASVTT